MQKEEFWVMCSDRLPDMYEIYLDGMDEHVMVSDFVWVTLQNRKVIKANLENGDWYSESGTKIEQDVICWMPEEKPQPYSG